MADGHAENPKLTEPHALDSAGCCFRNQACRSWLALVKSGGSLDVGPVMVDVGV